MIGLAERLRSALGAGRPVAEVESDGTAQADPGALDELDEILERARRAGIDPRRVMIALGIDHRDHPEPGPRREKALPRPPSR